MITVRWLYRKQRRDRKCGRIPCSLHLQAEKAWLRTTIIHGDPGAELSWMRCSECKGPRRDSLWSKSIRKVSAAEWSPCRAELKGTRLEGKEVGQAGPYPASRGLAGHCNGLALHFDMM